MQRIILVFLLLLAAVPVPAQTPMSSSFTYQGELAESGAALDGPVDLIFTLYDAASAGSIVNAAIHLSNVDVVDGVFTVELDYGPWSYDGDTRWLEIQVRSPHDPGNTAPFTTLDPRQKLTAAPYATHALNVENHWSVTGGRVYNDTAPFVGVGRSSQISSSEVFGVHANVSGSYGGMYVSTDGENGLPFYGYAAGGTYDAWHAYDGANGYWFLNNGGVNHLSLTQSGFLGLGAYHPTEKLEVGGTIYSNSGGFKFPDGTVQTSAATGGDGHSLDASDGNPGDAVYVNADGQVIHPYGVSIGTSAAPVYTLDVREAASTYGANLQRDVASAASHDLLQLVQHADSDLNSQLIEAQLGTDVKWRVWTDGDVTADGAFTGGGADFAEIVKVEAGASSVEPGDVMVIDRGARRGFAKSTNSRSTLVAGVYSTQPGVLASNRDWDALDRSRSAWNGDGEQPSTPVLELARQIDEVPLAVVGIVPCKVSAENGPIAVGDLLVTSNTPGHAMRAADPKVGTVVGKALEGHSGGTGVIEIMVTLQ